MLRGRRWHIQRLQFMISAARHFAGELTEAGYKVIYQKAATTSDGLMEISRKHTKLPIVSTQPSSRGLTDQLNALGVQCVENDFFLTSREVFSTWASSQKLLLMENFYHQQRTRLGILMQGTKPEGGAWNFDAENCLPPPISRMSNYCSSCKFNPKLRAGETACPFSTLYWDFLDRHKKEFAGNFRMAQQLKCLDRLTDLAELRERAKQVLTLLDRGEL